MSELKAHLFICTNKPESPGRCGSKNAEALRLEVKNACKNQEWGSQVRINSSGCLGHCERGIAAVLYPSGKWFFELDSKDSEMLFKGVETAVKQRN